MYKSAQQIRDDAFALLDSRLSGIRTESGEPVADLIEAYALEGERFNVLAEYVRKSGSVAGWRELLSDDGFKTQLADALDVSNTSLTTDFARRLGVPEDLATDLEAVLYSDLGRFASSLGRPRASAGFSAGTLRVYLSSNAPYTLLKGASARETGTTIVFDTVQDLIAANPSFDLTRNQYYVDVSANCRTPGKLGNAIRNTVTTIVAGMTGATGITNAAAFDGGYDRESNTELLAALDAIQAGVDINTLNGLKRFLGAQAGVEDVLVVGPGDPLMTRAAAGAVDCYIVGSTVVSAAVIVRVLVAGETYVIALQPVRAVSSAVGPGGPLLSGNGFTFVPDTGVFKGSSQARDSITWGLAAAGGPSAGDDVTVTYTYNSLMRDLQRLFDDDPDRDVPASNILIREATKLTIFVELKVVPLAGVVQADAEAAVQTALTNFFDDLKLGDSVDYSDALVEAAGAVINSVAVIDRVDGFKIGFSATTIGTDNLVVSGNQYARLESINFLAP